MINALMKVAPGFVFGFITTMVLNLIYGLTGWNILTTATILIAYFVGRLHTYLKETE